MNSNKNKTLSYSMALLTVILWASAFPGVRYALQYYSAESIMIYRFLIASAVLGVIAIIKKIKLPKTKDLPLLIIDGFVGIFLYMWFLNTGTKLLPSGISSFIVSSAPIFTIILSQVIMKEKTKLTGWIGIFISFAGLVIIGISQVKGFSINIGIFILIGSALCTSLHSIFQRQLLKTYIPIEATTYSIFFSTICMLIFVPNLINEAPNSTIAVNIVMIYLGIFPGAIGFLLWGYALSKAEKTTNVTMFLYLAPFISLIIAYFWLGEVLSTVVIVGGIIIIIGMILADKSLRKKG